MSSVITTVTWHLIPSQCSRSCVLQRLTSLQTVVYVCGWRPLYWSAAHRGSDITQRSLLHPDNWTRITPLPDISWPCLPSLPPKTSRSRLGIVGMSGVGGSRTRLLTTRHMALYQLRHGAQNSMLLFPNMLFPISCRCPKQTCARIPATFSLNPDPAQNKEEASFICVLAYCVYITIPR